MTTASRRAYISALLMLAAGGGLGLLASGRPWASAEVPSSFAVDSMDVSGNDLAPLVSAVPLVALAAVVLVPAVRSLGRRVAGAILAVLGAVMAVVSLVVSADVPGRAERWIASTPEHSGQVQQLSTSPAWALLTALAGLLVAVGGVLVAWRGPQWPSMGARYERPDRKRRETPVSSAQTWDALDRGDDPTAPEPRE
ncbi:Trp biosynthesis-associated membrane protein [Phytoactinopolyspora endophytica]|uniref:Trp biosynthesis-associated membrane protein n=1 Tax=Phytoactinopolyspora endophytica TaxID=1642495 RepID=UPI00101D750B|nr:Trp biosynthesis-associated membrane protein [Phytoactinopolyspora endophytica]